MVGPNKMTSNEIVEGLRKAEAELAAAKAELERLESEEADFDFGDEFEHVVIGRDALRKMSDEELQQHKAFVSEQIAQANLRIETNRRGVKLGYLRLANQARRCSHLRNDGEPCRAPAMGRREFCVFHSRGYDSETNQRVKVGFLEDRSSLQLVLKQIMEQVVSGKMNARDAALLLRAIQIAGSVLKPEKKAVQPAKGKPVGRETSRELGVNAEERWG